LVQKLIQQPNLPQNPAIPEISESLTEVYWINYKKALLHLSVKTLHKNSILLSKASAL